MTQTVIHFTDGRDPIRVRPNLHDSRNFEIALRKNKSWGSFTENPLRFAAFRAWSAARRTQQLDMSWEEFYESPETPVLAVLEEAEEAAEEEVEGLGEDTLTARSATS